MVDGRIGGQAAPRLAITGLGKMGLAVFEEAVAAGVPVVAGVDKADPRVPGLKFYPSERLKEAIAACDVVIDFSSPEFCRAVVREATGQGKCFVVGTTGLSPADLEEFARLAADARVSGMVSPNFSLGVNAFFEIVSFAARLLKGYDAEVVEMHHSQKRDAPSGTALKAAKAVLSARGQGDSLNYGRKGQVPRVPGEVGIHSVRAGQIVGDHMVIFAGNNEIVELRHTALSRKCFAAGCVQCAAWLAGKRDGKMHSVQEFMAERE